MKKFSFLATFLFLFATTAYSADNKPQANADAEFKAISQQQLLNPENQIKVILDVRTPEEYAAGHVPGAVNIPHDTIGKRLDELIKLNNGKTDSIAVYCRSGHRAGIALKILKKQGFSQLYHLNGDMNAWYANKRPIESKK